MILLKKPFTFIHFSGEGKKVLKLQALPSQNFPVKSHDREPKPRRELSVVKDRPLVNKPQKPAKDFYKDFDEFTARISKLKLNGWSYYVTDSKVHFKYIDSSYIVPKYEIVVDKCLSYQVIYLGWVLQTPVTSSTLKTLSISVIMNEILTFNVCPGITSSEQTVPHICVKKLIVDQLVPGSPQFDTFYRAPFCTVLINDSDKRKCLVQMLQRS